MICTISRGGVGFCCDGGLFGGGCGGGRVFLLVRAFSMWHLI